MTVIATKACTVRNIQHGFIEAGKIVGDNLCFPVFEKILAICRHNPSMEEYKNIENKTNTIIHVSCEYGHISKEVSDAINIVGDRDSMDCEVMRDATISQESYQHTKCLTHKHQIHI